MEGENRVAFPICKLDYIVTYCRKHILRGQEANHFTKADISKVEAVRRLYVRVLQYVFDARPDCFYMMPGDVNIPYPHLFENFVPLLNLYICMHSITSLCAIPNVAIVDFWRPSKKSTILILSGIINFLQFRRKTLETYLNQQNGLVHSDVYPKASEWTFQLNLYFDDLKVNLEAMQEMLSSNEEMKYRIQSLNMIPPEQQAKIHVLSTEVAELQQVINWEYRHKQSSFQDATTQQKAEIAEQNKGLSQLKESLANEKERLAKLKSMIVECPEQRKSEIQAQRETVEKKKGALQKKNDRTLELQDKLANFTNFQKKELENYSSFLQQSQTSYDQLSSIITETWKEENQLDRKKLECENMQKEETQIKRILCSKLEKQDKLTMQMQKKREAREHNLGSVATKCDQLKLQTQKKNDQVVQVSSERQHVLIKIKLLQENYDKDASEFENLISKLLTHLEQYHERLATVTQKTTGWCEQMAELERTMNERI